MQKKDVLIIGSDIAGCAVALSLAKIGVSVSIVPSPKKASSLAEELPFVEATHFFNQLKDDEWKKQASLNCSSQALEQIINKSEHVIKDLLGSAFHLQENSEKSVLEALLDKLKLYPNVEWLTDYSAAELITLENHSSRPSDIYKAPTCLGAFLYHSKSHALEPFFAKETILAGGGIGGLFPYSTSSLDHAVEDVVLARRAGVRCLDVEHFLLEPLCLFERDAPCIPMSQDILSKGGAVLSLRKEPLRLSANVGQILYQEMLTSRSEHLWLDLTRCDESVFQQYPVLNIFCKRFALDPKKDLLPIVPAVSMGNGGISVDKVGQTPMHRLRAVGSGACTGIYIEKYTKLLKAIESLVWSAACADDIGNQIKKYLYHFAEIKEVKQGQGVANQVSIEEELSNIKEVMWRGVAASSEVQQLHRALGILQEMERRISVQYRSHPSAFPLRNRIEAAIWVANSKRKLLTS